VSDATGNEAALVAAGAVGVAADPPPPPQAATVRPRRREGREFRGMEGTNWILVDEHDLMTMGSSRRPLRFV
jgi:hypothetical protein